jgi:disulfide bond formation protein DsbB
MSELNRKTTLVAALLFIISSIISVYFIEYLLNYKPCKLCLYERIPYFFSVLLILIILFKKKYEKPILLVLFLTFVVSATLAFYHFGIEKGFFNESIVCETESLSNNLTKDELLEQLKQNTISCKEANFRIMGLSLATINTIFSLILSAIFIRLFLIYEKN